MSVQPHVQANIDQMRAFVSETIDHQIAALLAVRARMGRDTASVTLAQILSEPPYDVDSARLSMLIVALDRLADHASGDRTTLGASDGTDG